MLPEVRRVRVTARKQVPPVGLFAAGLDGLLVGMNTVTELDGNARRGDVGAVAESLARFGQRKPIVVREGTGEIVAGNHTWLAARSLGWTHVAAVVLDLDDADARAFALADNRTGDLGYYDEGLLVEFLMGLESIAGTGYNEGDIEVLLARADHETSIPEAQDSTHEIDIAAWTFDHACGSCGFQWNG